MYEFRTASFTVQAYCLLDHSGSPTRVVPGDELLWFPSSGRNEEKSLNLMFHVALSPAQLRVARNGRCLAVVHPDGARRWWIETANASLSLVGQAQSKDTSVRRRLREFIAIEGFDCGYTLKLLPVPLVKGGLDHARVLVQGK